MPYVQAPGARLYYEECGSGTPIVFVHETMSDLRSWEAQVPAFSRRHRCIAFNARGYAPSEIGSDPSAHDHLRLADDVGVVMDALGVERAFVVGHSMGAYVTAHFALRRPERLLGMVLIGLGTGSDDPQDFNANARRGAEGLRAHGLGWLIETYLLGPSRVQLLLKDRRGWEAWADEARGFDAAGLANILEFCHARRPSIYASEAGFAQLKVPALVVVGDEDEACLKPGLFLKRVLPAVGLWVCPRSGHAVQVEEPGLFNEQLAAFIAAVEAGAWGERDPRTRGAQTIAPEEKR